MLNLRNCNINNSELRLQTLRTSLPKHISPICWLFSQCAFQHWLIWKCPDNFCEIEFLEKKKLVNIYQFLPHEYWISINPRLLGRHARLLVRSIWEGHFLLISSVYVCQVPLSVQREAFFKFSFSLVIQDENQNFFLSVWCFERRTNRD